MNEGVLQNARSRLALWLAVRAGLWGLGILGGAALSACLLDVAVDLPDQARAVAPWLLAGAALAVAAWGIGRWRQLSEPRVARWFEQAQPSLGNRLINAVQLSEKEGNAPVEEFLRREVVESGRQAASGLVLWPVVRSGVVQGIGVAGLVAVVWLALICAGGDLLRTVAPRFLDPFGDHPPYSRLQIEVVPKGAKVLYGGQVEVRASVHGRPADRLWLVSRSGANSLRTQMFLAPDQTFFQTLVNLREPAQYFVTDGRARSPRFAIDVRYTPQITLVEVTTTFPEYTGKAAHTAALRPEAQALPEGTRVSFRVVSNRPLKSGALTLTPVLGGKPGQIELKSGSPANGVSGGFALVEPVVFSISVRDIDGLDSVDPRQGRFNLLPDERPRIFVLEPGRDAVATPSIRVPVRVEAQDDYGITRVVWLRGLNRSIERPLNMKFELRPGPQSVEAVGAFDLEQLGVRPGDNLDYYFEAADNYPKGPNVTLSKLYRLQIISKEQYELVLRQAAARKALFEPYFKLDAWLRRLAERARNLEKLSPAESAAQKQAAAKEAAALAQDLAKYESELGKLLEQGILFEVEQSFRTAMVAQHNLVGQALRDLKGAMGDGQLDPKPLAQAVDQLSRAAGSQEEDVESPARQIAAVARLLARADSFVKLAREQAALAQLLQRFSDKNGELSRLEQMEMQELAHQQRRVQDGLRLLLSSLPELLNGLPEDESYAPLRKDVTEFLQAVAGAKIEEDLSECSRVLSGLDGKNGFVLARQAAEKMDRLIAKCSPDLDQQGKACLRFQPKLAQSLGNTLEQILSAMGVQSGNGQGGQDGFSLFNEDAALYGPNVELAGEQAGGQGETGQAASRNAQRVAGDSSEPGMKPGASPGRVRLQPNAKFPLRYRDLVGDYFRAIAESETDGGRK